MPNFATVVNARYGRTNQTKATLGNLQETGTFISSVGKWSDACTIREFLAHELGELLGEEHPDTILAMNNLANTLGDQGQLGEAARMEKEVLEKRCCECIDPVGSLKISGPSARLAPLDLVGGTSKPQMT
jgi:hypothetical protein